MFPDNNKNVAQDILKHAENYSAYFFFLITQVPVWTTNSDSKTY